MDWRVTARSGRPHTKLFQEEREQSILLIVDANPSMRFGTRVRFKSVQAARTAALLAWACVQSGDRIGALGFGPDFIGEVKPNGGPRGALRVLRRSGRMGCDCGSRRHTDAALASLAARAPHRASGQPRDSAERRFQRGCGGRRCAVDARRTLRCRHDPAVRSARTGRLRRRRATPFAAMPAMCFSISVRNACAHAGRSCSPSDATCCCRCSSAARCVRPCSTRAQNPKARCRASSDWNAAPSRCRRSRRESRYESRERPRFARHPSARRARLVAAGAGMVDRRGYRARCDCLSLCKSVSLYKTTAPASRDHGRARRLRDARSRRSGATRRVSV